MNIIYASCLCSVATFHELFSGVVDKPGQQVQKYHRLLTQGLCLNGLAVHVISALPVNRSNSRRTYLSQTNDFEEGVSFNYLPIVNIPFLKHIFIFFLSFLRVIFFRIRYPDCILICDVLNFSVSFGALIASKIVSVRSVAIVTDFPHHLSTGNNSLFLRASSFAMTKYDSYILLTPQMVDVLQCSNKPHVVIEGLVDVNMMSVANNLSTKYSKKVCLYAGAIQCCYGVDVMTRAFLKADVADSELHIYGAGDFEAELRAICEVEPRVKYFGVMLNDHIVQEQIRATMLINPRPAFDDFTKYSFPSKIMEYLVSGTPALVTRLPGIPSEYYNFLYLFDDESVDGIASGFKAVLCIDVADLHDKGRVAKDFVLQEKNNRTQAKKVLDMINAAEI